MNRFLQFVRISVVAPSAFLSPIVAAARFVLFVIAVQVYAFLSLLWKGFFAFPSCQRIIGGLAGCRRARCQGGWRPDCQSEPCLSGCVPSVRQHPVWNAFHGRTSKWMPNMARCAQGPVSASRAGRCTRGSGLVFSNCFQRSGSRPGVPFCGCISPATLCELFVDIEISHTSDNRFPYVAPICHAARFYLHFLIWCL